MKKNHDYIYYDEVRVTCVIIGPKRGLNIMAIQKRKKMSREWQKRQLEQKNESTKGEFHSQKGFRPASENGSERGAENCGG